MSNYDWPGNVRELENMVERAVILGRNEVLTLDDLPPTLTHGTRTGDEKHTGVDSRIISIPIGTPLARIKNWVILETLRDTQGDKSAAARQLRIFTRTIYRRLEKGEKFKS